MSSSASLLSSKSHSFCQALISPPSPTTLISKYFTPSSPKITEHGPKWCRDRLPFLAKTFTGTSGPDSCETYFELLSKTLKMHMHEKSFPSQRGFIVDADATTEEKGGGKGVVCVVGNAEFESVKTGKKWREKFMYRLSGFDEEGRIGHWEIWSDPLSAWDAVGPEKDNKH
ncbi:hypothetical protein EJ08DRAFT_684907 [Tothia fuscella]|uniref:Uncharacterized protein n=1 Tax=Tothia fuscella TaxID=1048955 RepID=A0A9P4P517_9PEZI|nr:hypothetical protein EJ08DRAFT_684907 [Tothia fuscella]